MEGRNHTKPYVFSHKVALSVDVGNLVCATGVAFVRFALGRVLHCKVEFRCADCSGMAASMLLIAVVHAVVLQGADCSWQWNCFVKVMLVRIEAL